MITSILPKTFLDYEKIGTLANLPKPDNHEVREILTKARELKGLSMEDAAVLLAVDDGNLIRELLETAKYVKQEIYGKRMVLFAPLYTGNHCTNNCTYCGFRRDNKELTRRTLTNEELKNEVSELLAEGHKRILMLCGETPHYSVDYITKAIAEAYSVTNGTASIRRINVEVAPMSVEDFRVLKEAKIGTYTCFQETYDPELYSKYHPSGPKSDYRYRLEVMDRAMKAGIEDVGVGVLFGLADYRFEVLSILEHANHLEKTFGCGPHTVSVPRIEPAEGASMTNNVPFPVSDNEFRKIIAIVRMTLPYTGIILSTREKSELRSELFHYGVSQISAGSRTNPGGYSDDSTGSQFSLGDHRSLEEVIADLISDEYIPSFCTGCYRKGRVGNDFMDMAKPGLIKSFCMPNGLFSFKEYLLDYANEKTRSAGLKLIEKLTSEIENKAVQEKTSETLASIGNGQRDVYL